MNEESLNQTNTLSTIFVEATVKVLMTKSICLEMPENYTEQDLITAAKKLVMTPDKSIQALKSVLYRMTGCQVAEGNGWDVESVNVEV